MPCLSNAFRLLQADSAPKKVAVGDHDGGDDVHLIPSDPAAPLDPLVEQQLLRPADPPAAAPSVSKTARTGLRTHSMVTRSMSRAALGDNSLELVGVLELPIAAMPAAPSRARTPLAGILTTIKSDRSIAMWQSTPGCRYDAWDHMRVTTKIDRNNKAANWAMSYNYNALLYGPLVDCDNVLDLNIASGNLIALGKLPPEVMAGYASADGTVDTKAASTKIGRYFRVSVNDALAPAERISSGNVIYANRTFFAKAFFLLFQSHRASRMARGMPGVIAQPQSVNVVHITNRDQFRANIDLIGGSFMAHQLVLNWDIDGQANLQLLPFIYALAAAGNPLRPNNDVNGRTLPFERVNWPSNDFLIFVTSDANVPVNVPLAPFNTYACLAWLRRISAKYQQDDELMPAYHIACNLFYSSFIYNHPPPLNPCPPPPAAAAPANQQPQAGRGQGRQPPQVQPPAAAAPHQPEPDLHARINEAPPQDVDIVEWLNESLTSIAASGRLQEHTDWIGTLNTLSRFDGYEDGFREVVRAMRTAEEADPQDAAAVDNIRQLIVRYITSAARRYPVKPLHPVYASARTAIVSAADLQLTTQFALPQVAWYNWFWVELVAKGRIQASPCLDELDTIFANTMDDILLAGGVYGAILSASFATSLASLSMTGGDVMNLENPSLYAEARHYPTLYNLVFGFHSRKKDFNMVTHWASTLMWYCFGGAIPRTAYYGVCWGSPLNAGIPLPHDEFYAISHPDIAVVRFPLLAVTALMSQLPQEWGLSLSCVSMNLSHETLDEQTGVQRADLAIFTNSSYAQGVLNALISYRPRDNPPILGMQVLNRADFSSPIIS